MNIKYLSIGATFVGAFLVKEQIVKELYESGKLNDEKVATLKSQFNKLSDQGLSTIKTLNNIEDTIFNRHQIRSQQKLEG